MARGDGLIPFNSETGREAQKKANEARSRNAKLRKTATFREGMRQVLVWVKNSLVLGRQDYQWRHELCLYGWLDGAAHYWGSDRRQTTVLEFDRPTRSDIHTKKKNVRLIE